MSDMPASSDTTQQDIIAAGRRVFTRHRYCAVSARLICTYAGVTSGALEAHFESKLALFTAVFKDLQHAAAMQITETVSQGQPGWNRLHAGIATFLDACVEPEFQTVVLKEGPDALGWGRWRELHAGYYNCLVTAFIELLEQTELGDRGAPILAGTMRGTLTELSLEIANSSDPSSTRDDAAAIVDRLLSSFRPARMDVPSPVPIRIGVGQLRSGAGRFLDCVAAGETIHIVRRGHVVARLLQWSADGSRPGTASVHFERARPVREYLS